MTDANRVNPPGKFVEHRSLSGAAAADSTTIDDANFPPADALHCASARKILAYYTDDSGGAGTIDVQVLVRDGSNGLWAPRTAVTLTGGQALELDVFGANEIFLRIDGVSAAGTNLKLRAALSDWMSGPSR